MMYENDGFICMIYEDHVIIENANHQEVKIARSSIPDTARVGDYVRETADGSYEVDHTITKLRAEELKQMRDDQFN